jgi:hypothetical protein
MERREMARVFTLALALLLAAGPAAAQPGPNGKQKSGIPGGQRGPGQLPNYYFDSGGRLAQPKGRVAPGDVANSLRARGFNNIGPVQRRGTTSITDAVGPAGEKVQLVIGPNGDIVGVRVLEPGGR